MVGEEFVSVPLKSIAVDVRLHAVGARATLRAAFLPFGELADVNMPMDAAAQKHKGFAFVQYDEKEDAAEAMDNMHNAELFGRVLRVNLAKPDAIKGGHRPVWEARADDFFRDGAGDEAAPPAS